MSMPEGSKGINDEICSDLMLMDMKDGMMTTMHQFFNKDAKPDEAIRLKGTESFDKGKKVLNVKYEGADGHVMGYDDLRILATDHESFTVSYSRNLNSMWILTMPVPNESMKREILDKIEEKLRLSDEKANQGQHREHLRLSSFNDIGLEEVQGNIEVCPWWFAINVTSTSAKNRPTRM